MKLIHKGGGKSKLEINSYRPVSIINVMNKLFGIIINEKLRRWIEEKGIIGEEQDGF